MKKSIFSLFAILTISFTLNSCKLIDKLTQFNVDYSTNFTIPATSVLGLPIPILNIVQPDGVTTNSTQTFTNNNTRSDLLEEVLLKKLVLTITNPSGQKFDFLKSADIFISADGLPEVKVASIDNIDDATVGNSVEMTTGTLDLKEYLKKSEITIRVAAAADKTTDNSITVKVDATFFVDAKILGI